jgi:hypothetical protein
MKNRVVIAAIVGVATVVSSMAADLPGRRQRLFWPKITLSKDAGERVTSVEVLMSCGRFRAVGNIPNDWSLEITSPSSEQTRLKASAGHGATTLWNLRELDGVISISVTEPSCFDIAAEVTTIASGQNRTFKFKLSELRLRQ